jgi:hypothetical protein
MGADAGPRQTRFAGEFGDRPRQSGVDFLRIAAGPEATLGAVGQVVRGRFWQFENSSQDFVRRLKFLTPSD